MKNSKWIYGILLISLIFSIQGCIFYKTVELSDTSPPSIRAIAQEKKFTTVQNNDKSQVYLVDNAVWQDGLVTGDFKILNPENHPENAEARSAFKGKSSKNYLHLYTNKDIIEGAGSLSYDDIYKVTSHKNDVGTSFLATTGVLIVGIVVAAATFVAIACSCPHVATINPDGSQEFQGSLFPGSIFKSLERKDYLMLKKVTKDEDDVLTVQVYNDLDEVQYLDEVKLLAVDHGHDHLGMLSNKELVAFNKGARPINAESQSNREALESVLSKDELVYEFNDPALESELNSLELSFNASALGDNPLLVIRGGQTELLEHTAEVFFQQFGTEFSDWVSSMNENDPENYKKNAVVQGISLNAYVMKDGEWMYQGSFENAGAMSMRDLALPLDIRPSSDVVRVKLETAFGFWKLDQVMMTSDWTLDMKVEKLDLISAINQDGDDVASLIHYVDETYAVQRLKGSSTDLKFKAPPSADVNYVLSGTGYYNHVRNYTSAPNKKFLRKMRRTKLSTHKLAQKVQLYKDSQLASN